MPYANFLSEDSDAWFNVGCAIAAVQTASSGVWIAFNGQIMNWNNCIRDEHGNFTFITTTT